MNASRRELLTRGCSGLIYIVGAQMFFGESVSAAARNLFEKSIQRRQVDQLPSFDGVLILDPEKLVPFADDFGHSISLFPYGVLRPDSTEDICKLARFCNERKIPLTMRGTGGAAYGQTQVQNGFIIDSTSLKDARWIGDTLVELEPGLIWREVLDFTNQRQRTPAVMPDTLVTSVGGKVSVGGIGETSHCMGAIVDQVEELEVVTPTGDVVRCSRNANAKLFFAMLGGMGQIGLISKVIMRTMAAPEKVFTRQFKYNGTDFKYLADSQVVAEELEVGAMAGHLVRNPAPNSGTFSFVLDVTHWEDSEPRWLRRMSAVQNGPTKEWSFYDYANRNSKSWDDAIAAGKYMLPHPYMSFYLPFAETEGMSRYLQTDGAANLGAGKIMISTLVRSKFKTSMFALPDSELISHFRVYRIVTTGKLTEPHLQMLDHNKEELVPRILNAGGTVYLPFSPLLSPTQVQEQFDRPTWLHLSAAKAKYDPNNILCVNAGLF